MKLALTIVLTLPLFAQLQDNTDKQLKCDNNNNDRGRGARHCEIRETSMASIGRLSLDAGSNGGVTVKGWLRGDVLVRARIDAQAENEGAAANLASRVNIETAGGQVRPNGPEGGNNAWWSASFEIFVPQVQDLTVKTYNGGLNIQDINGQIRFEGMNGGVNLKRVMGDINGGTVNGGINIEMAGHTWNGRQMELKTTNGGVNLAMPANFSARIQAETGMGRISSDFPLPPSMNQSDRSNKMDFNVGAGGPPIHITTHNGGIHIKRSGGAQ